MRSENGPQPIQYSEIESFSHLVRCHISEIELDMLTGMDTAYLSESGEQIRITRERMLEKSKAKQSVPTKGRR